MTNCVAVNNGWRNNLDTAFYKTGFYLSCGVTLTNCESRNNKNNGFWVWQSAKDVILNSCTDDGSDKAFQVRTGTNLKFNDCTSKNARTYALYAWGTSGAIFNNFTIINPKKSSGAVCLGLREDHPNDPWPVTGCTFDILLTGANKDTLIRYYNANNNQITINGIGPVTINAHDNGYAHDHETITTHDHGYTAERRQGRGPRAPSRPRTTTREAMAWVPRRRGREPRARVSPGRRRHRGTAMRPAAYVVGWTRPSEWLQYTVTVAKTDTYDVAFKVATPNAGTSFKLAVDGTDATTVSVPNTGAWNTFKAVTRAGHPDRRQARPPRDDDHRVPQPRQHEVHRAPHRR